MTPSPVRLLLLVAALLPAASAGAFQARSMSAAEMQLELDKLSVLGSALYVAAHPDDENTNLLAYLSKGRLVRAAYLSLTRGEGGQNLIGREQGDALGLLRTEELLAARAIDGAEQFFTRAIDFGYSKSPAEAIDLWGESEIVSDIVRVIRSFRPDVIITRFSPSIGGHGHHTASAILTARAFELASDPSYTPDGGPVLPPWKPRRLLFNGGASMPGFDTAVGIRINTGGYNALLGESYNEISGRSRSMHKSQGFGAAQNRGNVTNYFHHTAGDPAASDLLEGVDLSWSRVEGGERMARLADSLRRAFDPRRPAALIGGLVRAWREAGRIGDRHWAEVKRRDLLALIFAAAGLHAEATASVESAAPGDSLRIRASVINRSAFPLRLRSVRTSFGGDNAAGTALADNRTTVVEFSAVVPPDARATSPYWLERKADGFRYDVPDTIPPGAARGAPPHRAVFTIEADGEDLVYETPVMYRTVDPVEGELYRPFTVRPPVSIVPEERVLLFPDAGTRRLFVRLSGGGPGEAGALRLELPTGWSSDPAEIPFSFGSEGAEIRVSFGVTPSPEASGGPFSVAAAVRGSVVRTGTTVIRYPHVPAQTLFPRAGGTLLRAPVERMKFFVGYIEGSGDEVPEALRQIGYDVRLLTDGDLASADLAPFQAIVAGVRAYNTRPALAAARDRLMEYVRAGGTFVAQYATNGRLETDEPGPYPFTISRERVSDESAPVTLLAPDHPALSFPNRISPADFEGWVQERGLYFAGSWDNAYVPLLASNDPGEPPRRGGLIVARHGEGYYCYTGLSFFRQLPAGVPGAYRLLANLVELGSRERLRGRK